MITDTSLIVLEFAESAYTAVEEGDAITVCIDLVSVTVPLVENVFVGFNSPGFRDNALRTFQSFVTLREADVGESIYCANVSYPFDSTLQGDQQLRIEAFATVDGSDMVSFTPGGDRADLMLIDATGKLNAACGQCKRVTVYPSSSISLWSACSEAYR